MYFLIGSICASLSSNLYNLIYSTTWTQKETWNINEYAQSVSQKSATCEIKWQSLARDTTGTMAPSKPVRIEPGWYQLDQDVSKINKNPILNTLSCWKNIYNKLLRLTNTSNAWHTLWKYGRILNINNVSLNTLI